MVLFLGFCGMSIKLSKAGAFEYFFGSNKISTFRLVFTVLATQIGGGVLIGSSELAKDVGFVAFFSAFGIGVSLFFVAIFVGKMLKSADARTVADLFYHKTESVVIKRIATFVQLFLHFVTLIAMAIAVSKFLQSFDVSTYQVFAIWLVISIYSSVGGFNVLTKTDRIQFLIIAGSVLTIVVLFFLNFNEYIGLFKFNNGISDIFTIPPENSSKVNLFRWIFAFSMTSFVAQDMCQRCVASNDVKQIRTVFLSSIIIFFFIILVPVFFGALGRFADIDGNGSVFVSVIKLFNSPVMYYALIILLIFAITSTIDSLMCATSLVIYYDVARYLVKGEKQAMITSKLALFIMSTIVFAVSLFFNDVAYVNQTACVVTGTVLGFPVFLIILRPKTSKNTLKYLVIISGISCLVLQLSNAFGNQTELYNVIFVFISYVILEIRETLMKKKQLV